jgi:hypothetical protein
MEWFLCNPVSELTPTAIVVHKPARNETSRDENHPKNKPESVGFANGQRFWS